MARAETPAQFAASLLEAAGGAHTGARAVVKKGQQNIKTEGRANVLKSAPVHNAHAAYAITYDDPTTTLTRVEGEVGYDKDLPGASLGNLLEYGGKGDKSPAHRDLGRALDNEEPRFEDAIRLMALKLL